jgi:hypothetical protein
VPPRVEKGWNFQGEVTGLLGGVYGVTFNGERTVAEGTVEIPAQGTARIALTPRPR